MTVSNWAAADSDRAREIWLEYLRHHDMSGRTGETVGIDPASGRIWFGESVQAVITQRDADGSSAPLFLIRVGYPTYYRKGAHVNARFVGRAVSLLAANQQIEEDVFLVDFPFDGRMVQAQATFSDCDEILLGTGMLSDYRLQIDFPARTVIIEKA
jgi:hypothetical protein